jgi:hypothetical protein
LPRTFSVLAILMGGRTYQVLMLSGTSHNPLTDLVLLAASAFCDTATVLALYPAFGRESLTLFSSQSTFGTHMH